MVRPAWAQFFDRVHRDILIDRSRKEVADAGVLRLVRAYLTSGIREAGEILERSEGRRKVVRCLRFWPT